MFKLMLMRGIVVVFTLALALWYDVALADNVQHHFLVMFGSGFVIFILLQWWALHRWVGTIFRLFLELFADVLLVSTLIFITGGFHSPFILLLGLVIVVAGTQANALIAMSIAVSACIAYLTCIYAYAWWQMEPLQADSTLSLLLQISVMMLIGGIMAAISNYQSGLQKESRRAVLQHRQLQKVHSRLLASMNEGVMVLGKDLSIQDSNDAARQILKFKDNVSDMTIHDIWPISPQLVHFLESGSHEFFKSEWHIQDNVYLISARMLPEGESFAYWLLTLVDISELRSLESQLLEQEKLALMGRMAAMLAHEFRNPMQTIAQAVDLFGKVDETQTQEVRRIVKEEIARLNHLVGDMLDFSRPLRPEPTQTNMVDLVDSALQRVDMEQNLQLRSKVEWKSMMIDGHHFRLVLDNLLRNAVQASPEPGTIRVVLKKIGDHHWQLIVEDEGGGIPEEFREKIFEPFATKRPGGTGIGMATVWQACRANGWDIDIANTSRGTKILVTGED